VRFRHVSRAALIALTRAIGAVGIAIAFIVLVRLAPAEEFGLFAALVAVQQVLAGVSGLNAPAFVIREESAGRFGAVRNASRINIVFAFVGLAAFVPIALIFSVGLLLYGLTAYAAASAIDQMAEVRIAVLAARERFGLASASLAVRGGALLPFYWALLELNVDPLLGMGLARLAASVLGLLFLSRIHLTKKSADQMSSTFRAMMPIAGAGMASIPRNLDATIAVALAGPIAGGQYAAMSRFVAPANIVASAASTVLMGSAARSSSASSIRTLDLMGVIFCACTIVPVALLPVSSELARSVFGPSYGGAGLLLVLTLMRLGPSALSPMQSTILQANGHERFVLRNAIVVTVLVLASVAAGAALGGASGAAALYLTVMLSAVLRVWWVGRGLLAGRKANDG